MAGRPRSPIRGSRTGNSSPGSRAASAFPVFGSGDCIEPEQFVERLRPRRRVGRARRSRCAAQSRGSSDRPRILLAGRTPRVSHRRRPRAVPARLHRHAAAGAAARRRRASATSRRDRTPAEPAAGPARGHDRWVINKLRALNSWYTKGLDNGSHLRVAINAASSIGEFRDVIQHSSRSSEVAR